MAESIVTANRLARGVVVWLDSAEVWTERLDALQAALDRIRNQDRDVVVDIRDIPVDMIEGRPVPQARRERLLALASGMISPQRRPRTDGRVHRFPLR